MAASEVSAPLWGHDTLKAMIMGGGVPIFIFRSHHIVVKYLTKYAFKKMFEGKKKKNIWPFAFLQQVHTSVLRSSRKFSSDVKWNYSSTWPWNSAVTTSNDIFFLLCNQNLLWTDSILILLFCKFCLNSGNFHPEKPHGGQHHH